MLYDKKVSDIFETHTGINFEKNEELWDTPFFGYELNIPVREIVVSILEISTLIGESKLRDAIFNDELYTYRQIKKIIS